MSDICANCETMATALEYVSKVLVRVLPKGDERDKLIKLCENAQLPNAGAFLRKRAAMAEGVVRTVIEDIRSTGPFKITPSRSLKMAIARWSEMTFPDGSKL